MTKPPWLYDVFQGSWMHVIQSFFDFIQSGMFGYHVFFKHCHLFITCIIDIWTLKTPYISESCPPCACMQVITCMTDWAKSSTTRALLKVNPGWVSCTWVQGSKDICKGQKKYAIEFTIYFLGNFSRRQKLIPIRLTSWWAFIIFMGTVICLHLSWPMMGFIQNLWINVCIVHLHAI